MAAMADAPETPAAPSGPEGAAAPLDGDGKPLGPNGEKALAAERDARKAAEKRAADAEAKVAEAEKAKLTEQERATVERDEARKEAAEARAELARIRVGSKYGLSPDDVADLSTAGSPEDFDARAKRLAERLKVTGATPAGNGGLPPSPNAGRGTGKGPSGSEVGLAKARERFPQLAVKQ
jgi:colicin import membrane protein